MQNRQVVEELAAKSLVTRLKRGFAVPPRYVEALIALVSARRQSGVATTDHLSVVYGRGAGVGRTLGVGADLGVGVTLGVDVGVAVGVPVAVTVGVAVAVAVEVAVAVAVAVALALAVAVGVGVGVAPPDGDTRT